MAAFSQFEWLLWGIVVVAQTLLLVKLQRNSYLAGYRFFAMALLANLLASILALFSLAANFFWSPRFGYGWTFLVASYIVPLFYFFWIQELFEGILDPYPAVHQLARKTLRVLLAILAIAALAWYFYLTARMTNDVVLLSAYRFQQTCALTLALYLLFFLIFLSWMPVPLTPNLFIHAFCTGAFFLLSGATRLAVEMAGFERLRFQSSAAELATSAFLYGVWLWRWSPAGEHGLRIPSGPLDEEAIESAMARMNALERTLKASGPQLLR